MNAKPQPTTFYGVTTDQNWTHIHLPSGRKGREVSRSDGEVVIQCDQGLTQSYEENWLHLTWAPMNRDSQGENA